MIDWSNDDFYADIGGKCAFNVYLFPKKMKRPQRKEDGTYHINGKKFRELFGSRQQVMNGTCYKTAGELVKSDLMMNKWGRIVSRKKHATAKKEKRLLKSGYTAKKGKFGYVKVGTKKNRKTRKMRGGVVDCDMVKLNNDLTVANNALAILGDNEDKTAANAAVTAARKALEACKEPPSEELVQGSENPVEPGSEELVEPGSEKLVQGSEELVEPGSEEPTVMDAESSNKSSNKESLGGKKGRGKKRRGGSNKLFTM